MPNSSIANTIYKSEEYKVTQRICCSFILSFFVWKMYEKKNIINITYSVVLLLLSVSVAHVDAYSEGIWKHTLTHSHNKFTDIETHTQREGAWERETHKVVMNMHIDAHTYTQMHAHMQTFVSMLKNLFSFFPSSKN